MFNRCLISLLTLLVFNLSIGTVVFSQGQDDKKAQRQRNVEIEVNKIGVSDKIPVVVKLEDGRKSVKGYITEITDDGFTVIDKKKKTTTSLKYSEVKKVSRDVTRNWVIAGIIVGGLVVGLFACVAAGRCQE